MIILASTGITSATWLVTGLGFGIVLLLLFCLIFILQAFGWIMQRIEAPKTEKPAAKAEAKPAAEKKSVVKAQPSDDGTKAAIAMALASAEGDDEAAVAYALYLAHNSRHDLPTAMINLKRGDTAWNMKSFGLNNQGF